MAKRSPNGSLLKFVMATIDNHGDECILWPFGVSGSGYGNIKYEGRHMTAHSLVLTLVEGESPGKFACHQPGIGCQRLCINPTHLRWATPKENTADQVIDGTSLRGRGAKLTPDQVRAIRVDTRTWNATAAAYGVKQSTIMSIKTGRTWKWLD